MRCMEVFRGLGGELAACELALWDQGAASPHCLMPCWRLTWVHGRWPASCTAQHSARCCLFQW